ncbi:MAG: DNA N-6-adenine-methyltransferase [Gammaproteobacteria bacterium]
MTNGDEWETPDDLFDALDTEFEFTMDFAASHENAKCHHYLRIEDDQCGDDGLKFGWGKIDGFGWLNPPYSRGLIEAFMHKAHKESLSGARFVTLTRFDPSTDWWQKFVNGRATEVRMLAHRVKFKGAPSAYNFPCAVSVFDSRSCRETRYRVWSWRQ